jgi:hypothetical protein
MRLDRTLSYAIELERVESQNGLDNDTSERIFEERVEL